MGAIKDSSIYVTGEIVAKSLPFILMPYLARKLGPEGYGELSYFLTWVAIMSIFVGMSQHGAVARYFYKYGKRSIGLVVNSGLLFSFITIVPFVIYGVLTSNEVLLLITFCAFSMSILSVQLTLRQCQRRATYYTVIQLLSSLLSVLLTIALFELIQSVPANRLLAIASGNMVCASVCFVLYFKNKNSLKLMNINNLKKALYFILAFGGPLIFHHLSLFAKGTLDRLFIEDSFGLVQLGLYAASFQLVMIIQVLFSAVNKAIVPYYYSALKNKALTKKSIFTYASYSLLIVPISVTFFSVIPETWYLLILGEEFMGVKELVVAFSFGTSLFACYFILVNYLFYFGMTGIVAKINVLSALIHVFCVLLLSTFSMKYVPFSLFISNVVLIVGIMLAVYYHKCKE